MKPKYNIGDEVWVLSEQKAHKRRVECIVHIKTDHIDKYVYKTTPHTDYSSVYVNEYEEHLFASKEELIASLG